MDFAGVRVRHVLPAPPAFGLQYRRQLLAELFQGLPAFGGFDHGGIDITDHIHAGGFGHSEGGGVRIIQHVLPVPRYVDAFLPQVGYGSFGLHAEDGFDVFGVHSASSSAASTLPTSSARKIKRANSS